MEVNKIFRIFCESKNRAKIDKLTDAISQFFTNQYAGGLPHFSVCEIELGEIDIEALNDRKALFYNPNFNKQLEDMSRAYALKHPLVLTIHVGWWQKEISPTIVPENLKFLEPTTTKKLASEIMITAGDYILELNAKISRH